MGGQVRGGKKTVWIKTQEDGKGVHGCIITEYTGRTDFFQYADQILLPYGDKTDWWCDSIAKVCDRMRDCGPGTGSRWHEQVNEKVAREYLRHGATNISSLSVRKYDNT